jgi:O-antigen/teichoic acid export membrane protein
MSSGRSLDAIIAFAVRVASAGLVFALQVLLARLMALDAYGNYVTLWTWMIALGSFGALGFAESSVRFLPRYAARQREGTVAAFWRFGLFAAMGFSVLLAGLAALVAIVFGAGADWQVLMLFVCLGLPFMALEHYLEGVARSFGWYQLTTVPVYIVRPILTGSVALAVFASTGTLGFTTIGLVVIGCQAAIVLSVGLLLAARLRRFRPRAGAARGRLWLMASMPLLLISGCEDLMTNSDVLLVALLLDAEQAAIYFAAARTLALANFVYYATYLVAGRGFALALVDTDKAALQRSVRQSSRLTLISTVVALAATLLVAPLLLMLFGAAFTTGYPLMFILAAGLLARSLAGQANELLIVAGRQRESIVIAVGALVVTVVAVAALTLAFGVMGAAMGTALGLLVRAISYVVVVRRVLGVSVLAVG